MTDDPAFGHLYRLTREVSDAFDPERTNGELARYLAEYTQRAAEREADVVRLAARLTLRPRLRWAATHPRVLRVLKDLGLWHVPTLHTYRGHIVRVTRSLP
jgi:hypothetical protein